MLIPVLDLAASSCLLSAACWEIVLFEAIILFASLRSSLPNGNGGSQAPAPARTRGALATVSLSGPSTPDCRLQAADRYLV